MVFTLVFSPEIQSKAMNDYLTRYGKFQTQTYENRLFSQLSNREIADLQREYKALDGSYGNLSFDEKRKVTRPNFPYAKIEKNGVISYKKVEDLTAEERQTLGC